jgi:hypothetical protein
MPANMFSLTHHHVRVEYRAGTTPGIPSLLYHEDGRAEVRLESTQITTEETALGVLVAFTLEQAIDAGAERFGFLLPQLEIPAGKVQPFCTVGVYERTSGPDSVPETPPQWRAITLDGVAESVIVPL